MLIAGRRKTWTPWQGSERMTAKRKTITLDLPEDLLDLAEIWGKEQGSDRNTVLRQWLYQGTEEPAIKLLSEGRISKGDATAFLNVTYFDINRMLEERGIRLGVTLEQYESSGETARRLRSRAGP